jgi:hypothetical protein
MADLGGTAGGGKAAMDTGVARKPIVDMGAYRQQLNARRDRSRGLWCKYLTGCAAGPGAWSSRKAKRSK